MNGKQLQSETLRAICSGCRSSALSCRRACLLLWISQALLAQVGPLNTTRYVNCVRDGKGQDVASRTVRTPVFKSKQESRAYGVVIARHSAIGCQNITSVYISDRGDRFRAVFHQHPEPRPDGTVYDGNGIEAIRWSPSGKLVLAELSQWTWGTDSGWNIKYLIATVGERIAREIQVGDAVAKQFRHPCAREVKSKGWLDDKQIEIEVSPAKDVDEEGTPGGLPSCVQKPTRFRFNVVSGTLAQNGPSKLNLSTARTTASYPTSLPRCVLAPCGRSQLRPQPRRWLRPSERLIRPLCRT